MNARNSAIFSQPTCAALRPFVRRLFVVESLAAHSDAHWPETGLIAALRFSGDCHFSAGCQAPPAALTGIWNTLRTHHHSHNHAAVIITFTTTGAAALLRQPLADFANQTRDLQDVLAAAPELANLQEQLTAASSHAERMRRVESFLLRLADGAQLDPLTTAAVRLIEQTTEQTTAPLHIADLASALGLSQSALERRFRRQVGIAPRPFASLVRLQNVLRLRATGGKLTTLAHAAGYYDQSHFIKEFRRITGAAPSAFFTQ